MPDVQLDTSYLEGGITTVDFFNGRVLTAEDLRDQHAGLVERDRRVARVAGDGVAAGFHVTRRDATTLSVTAGLAVNPMGDVLELTGEGVDVPLVVTEEGAAGNGDPFSPCVPGAASGLTGEGVYVFCVSSAVAAKGGAPAVDFDAGGVAASCGPRYSVQGLAFRLVPVDIAGLAEAAGLDSADTGVLAAGEDEGRARVRNVLAHLFLGTVASRRAYADAFGDGTSPEPVDELRRDGRLTDCDVPLAIVTWLDFGADPGVELVDVWGVRRDVVSGESPESAWGWLPAPRRLAHRRAALMQFQEQLQELVSTTSLVDLDDASAVDHFRYLPAAGVVPVRRDGVSRRAFETERFFAGVTVAATGTIAGAQVEALLRASLWHPPVDLGEGEPVFLYKVRENEDRVAAGTAAPFVLFCSTALPFQGEDDLEITAVFPSGPLHPGDPIEVRGHGFGFSTGTSELFFDAIQRSPLAGSTDRKLLVVVPEELDVPEEGRLVSLRAENGDLNDTVSITVMRQEVELAGEIDVDWIDVKPAELAAGKPASFRYRITSRLNRTADIALGAAISPDDLTNEMTLLDDAGDEIEGFDDVEVEGHRDLVVHLNDLQDDPIVLAVTATAGEIAQSDVRTFSVGEVEPPDDDIAIEVNAFELQEGGPEDGSYDPGTSTITLRPGFVGTLDATAVFERAGSFKPSFDPTPPVDGWNVAFTDMVPSDPYQVDDAELESDGVARRPLDLALMPDEGAASTAVTLVVEDQETRTRRTKTFNLELGG